MCATATENIIHTVVRTISTLFVLVLQVDAAHLPKRYRDGAGTQRLQNTIIPIQGGILCRMMYKNALKRL